MNVSKEELMAYAKENEDYCSFCKNLQTCLKRGTLAKEGICSMFQFDPNGGKKR